MATRRFFRFRLACWRCGQGRRGRSFLARLDAQCCCARGRNSCSRWNWGRTGGSRSVLSTSVLLRRSGRRSDERQVRRLVPLDLRVLIHSVVRRPLCARRRPHPAVLVHANGKAHMAIFQQMPSQRSKIATVPYPERLVRCVWGKTMDASGSRIINSLTQAAYHRALN